MSTTETKTAEPMRMNAYYYGFEPTGVPEIDLVLSAVACAGKAFHHTESWADEASVIWPHLRGKTPVDWIQNAATDAAAKVRELAAKSRALRLDAPAVAEAGSRLLALARSASDGPQTEAFCAAILIAAADYAHEERIAARIEATRLAAGGGGTSHEAR